MRYLLKIFFGSLQPESVQIQTGVQLGETLKVSPFYSWALEAITVITFWTPLTSTPILPSTLFLTFPCIADSFDNFPMCYIPFNLTILSLLFPTLTPPDIISDIPLTLLLSTDPFNNFFSQPLFLFLPFLWHITIPSSPTSVFSTNLISLFSKSALIFHYLHVLSH